MSDDLTSLEFGWWRKPLPLSYRNLHPSLTAGRHEDVVYLLADVHPGREAEGRTLLTLNLKTLQTKKYAARGIRYVPQTPSAIFVYDGLLVSLYARCCSAAVPPGGEAPVIPEALLKAQAEEALRKAERDAKRKPIPPPPPRPPAVNSAPKVSREFPEFTPTSTPNPTQPTQPAAASSAIGSDGASSVGGDVKSGVSDANDLQFRPIEMSLLCVNSTWIPAGVLWGSFFVVFGGYDTANVVMVDMKPLVQQWHAPRVTGGLEWRTVRASDGHCPCARIDHSAAVVGNNMVVFGGRTGTGLLRNDAWSFDLINHVWTEIKLEYPAPQLLFNTAFVNPDETTTAPDGSTSIRFWAWGRRLKYFRPFCAELGLTLPPTPQEDPHVGEDKTARRNGSSLASIPTPLTSELRLHPEDLVSDNSHCAPSFAVSRAGLVYMFTINSGATDWAVSCLIHVRPLPPWSPSNHREHSEEYQKRVGAFVRACDYTHGYMPVDILTSIFAYLDNADVWQSSLAPVIAQGPTEDENVVE